MKSSTLRWILLSISVIIAMIVLVQLYWLKRVYSLEEQQFNSAVSKGIRGLFEDIEVMGEKGVPVRKIIEIPDANTFLIKIKAIPEKDSLQFYLGNEFDDFNVWTPCEVQVFDAATQSMAYQFYLSTASDQLAQPQLKPGTIKKGYNFLLLHFPYRKKYIIQEMIFWIITAVALLLVLIGLSVSLVYLYRQKFLNELQKDFVNNFTHEFKTPLAVMKIASDVLIQKDIVQKPDRLLKYGTVIKEQTEHLQGQVERLLKTATTESANIVITKEPCNLNQLVQHAIDQLEPLAVKNQAVIEVKECEAQPIIAADKNHLELVLINLLENAIKYSNGNPYILVTVEAADNQQWAVSVKDNGIGIEDKHIKYLFNKFYRVHNGNVHHVNGFGLGLNFVKKIVDAHNGKIIIRSVPGIGTEFKILLPVK